MKGATVVTSQSIAFLEQLEVVAADLGLGSRRGEASLQVHDIEGRLLTAFVGAEPNWEWSEAFLAEVGRSLRPARPAAYAVECRWEQLFCEVINFLSSRLGEPMWIVDGDGKVLLGGSIDPKQIRL